MLSGIRDVDREILSKLDDKSLLIACSTDKYTWNTVCDDNFLKRRLLAKYPEIEKYKKVWETWKAFFLRATHYIALIKEKYDYEYNFGNFFTQYVVFEKFYKNLNNLLIESIVKKELALVIWSLKNGADIHAYDDLALRISVDSGNFEILKYLIENGANIHSRDDEALLFTSYWGKEEMVKYLVENGADIHALDDSALKFARKQGHNEIVKYLESKM
jgi:hypothetical protein